MEAFLYNFSEPFSLFEAPPKSGTSSTSLFGRALNACRTRVSLIKSSSFVFYFGTFFQCIVDTGTYPVR